MTAVAGWSSVRRLRERRRAVAEALGDLVDLRFWNAGGSGSVETSAADPVVTEVTVAGGGEVRLDEDRIVDRVPTSRGTGNAW